MDNLEEFHLFRKLPIELRMKIWKKALPRSRTIRLQPTRCYLQPECMSFALRGGAVMLDCLLPVLQACAESRDACIAALPIVIPMSKCGNGVLRFSTEDELCLERYLRRFNNSDSIVDFKTQPWTSAINKITFGFDDLCDLRFSLRSQEQEKGTELPTAFQVFSKVKYFTFALHQHNFISWKETIEYCSTVASRLRSYKEVGDCDREIPSLATGVWDESGELISIDAWKAMKGLSGPEWD